ncbi:MAG: DUF4093 domain-containing protein [Eubacteriales bacterium]|nr:DUF4093 domain-containing protein [Eubacteriales bacterium]
MMRQRPRIREVIVVEGKYDKNTLLQVVDATVLETNGFGIFRDTEKQQLLRCMAEARGLILLTDPDGAGFLIRGHLKSILPRIGVKHAYIPDLYGRERRKTAPSREGKLGVEGMTPEILFRALRNAGATFENEETGEEREKITKTDLYFAGLSGRAEAASRRSLLLRTLDLPERLSPNVLPEVLSTILTKEEFKALTERLFLQNNAGEGCQNEESDR